MGKLIHYQMRKFSREISFYIILGINLALIVLSVLLYAYINSQSNLEEERRMINELAGNLYTGTGFFLSSLAQNNFLMLVGIYVALTTSSDYTSRTVRNIFARGYSRSEFYFSKAVSVTIALTIAFFVSMVFSFAVSSIFLGNVTGDAGKIAMILGLQYLSVLATGSLIFMISSLFRKTGIAVASAILVPDVIGLILALFSSIPNLTNYNIFDYWLSSFLTSLSTITVTNDRMLQILLLSVAYIVAFILGGYAFSRKTEV